MTAENVVGAVVDDGYARASMRPRPMTAENGEDQGPARRRVDASMRPRPMTAENTSSASGSRAAGTRFNEAAADDRGKRCSSASVTSCGPCGFNEAAADDRGKRRPAHRGAGRPVASMRPRPMTAENAAPSPATIRPAQGFNEAAADDRGKRRRG